jgi:transposase
MAIERCGRGEHPADAIASFGFNPSIIYKWRKAAAQGGDEALESTPATGRPPNLTPEQEPAACQYRAALRQARTMCAWHKISIGVHAGRKTYNLETTEE